MDSAFLSFILHFDGFVDDPMLFLKRKVCSRVTSADPPPPHRKWEGGGTHPTGMLLVTLMIASNVKNRPITHSLICLCHHH